MGGGKEALKLVLQDEGGQGQQDHPAVGDAVFQHLPLGAQQSGQGPEEQLPQHRQQETAGQGDRHQHGKNLVGLFLVPLAQGFGDEGAAAGAEHKADGTQNHQDGHNKVDGGKGGFAHIVGDKEAVHHAINRGEYQHHNGRQGITQQTFIVEMVG